MVQSTWKGSLGDYKSFHTESEGEEQMCNFNLTHTLQVKLELTVHIQDLKISLTLLVSALAKKTEMNRLILRQFKTICKLKPGFA